MSADRPGCLAWFLDIADVQDDVAELLDAHGSLPSWPKAPLVAAEPIVRSVTSRCPQVPDCIALDL